jgi:FkbM family methyltransferase
LLTKEPETIKWLEQIPNGSVLWDVGANVGVYSLYAAKRGVKVVAFEPNADNFSILNKNIRANHAEVMALPVALTDGIEGFVKLGLSGQEDGGSMHGIGQSGPSQMCYASTGDRLIDYEFIPAPQYLKVDVDGLDREVLVGLHKNLAGVKSICIECVSFSARDAVDRYGFGMRSKGNSNCIWER